MSRLILCTVAFFLIARAGPAAAQTKEITLHGTVQMLDKRILVLQTDSRSLSLPISENTRFFKAALDKNSKKAEVNKADRTEWKGCTVDVILERGAKQIKVQSITLLCEDK